MVNRGLVACVHPQHQRRDPRVDIGDRLQNAFTHPLLLVAIAQFHGFMLAGGRTTRNQGASERSAFQGHFALKRWVSAGIKDLTGVDGIDFKHGECSYEGWSGSVRNGQVPVCQGRAPVTWFVREV